MKKYSTLLLLFLLVIVRAVFFETIISRPLNDFDEARYAEVAKNILKTGEWLVPLAGGPDEPRNVIFTKTGNGSNLYPYFWKPPFHTWVMASFMAVFGVNELAVRLPSLLFSIGVMLLVFLFTKKIFRSHLISIISVAVLMSLPDFSFLASQGLAEMQLLFFSLLTVYLFARGKNIHFLLSGVAFGLSIMTKSLAVFWVFPVCLIVYLLSNKRFPNWRGFLLFIASSLLIALPWHIYMYQQFGWLFINKQFITNFSGRLLGTQQNIAPWYWYGKYILQFWLPWSLILMIVSVTSMINRLLPWRLLLPLFLWISLIVIPFSIVQSKVWWYIFPSWIPMIFIIVAPLEWFANRSSRIFGMFLVIIACVSFVFSCKTALARDFGTTQVRALASRNKDLTSLSVVGRAYESVLYYFDTGNISTDWKNSTYLLTSENQLENFSKQGFVKFDQEGDLILLKK